MIFILRMEDVRIEYVHLGHLFEKKTAKRVENEIIRTYPMLHFGNARNIPKIYTDTRKIRKIYTVTLLRQPTWSEVYLYYENCFSNVFS